MERDHEFTVKLPGDGSYAVKLLEGVHVERVDGTTLGHWPAFELDAEGDSDAEVFRELLSGLQQQLGAGSDSPEFESFAAYVREHGSRLSDEEVADRELAQLRSMTTRWRVTDDEQYMVRLWQDVEVQRDGDRRHRQRLRPARQWATGRPGHAVSEWCRHRVLR